MMAPSDKPPEEEDLERMTFGSFLEKVAPGTAVEVTDFYESVGNITRIKLPIITLHCSSQHCNGDRFFRCASEDRHYPKSGNDYFLLFACRNCGRTFKKFAITIGALRNENGELLAIAQKYGEMPRFGPPVPARVITLIGPDRELFLKGRRAELFGLGIGAFTYYRRVVERQKNRLLDEMCRVASKTRAPQQLIDLMESAKAETQFSKAVESIRDSIPEQLKIDGHNPLTLLHAALSKGLHEHSDFRCLELANSIRAILESLAERMGDMLRDQAELNAAVARLTQAKSQADGE